MRILTLALLVFSIPAIAGQFKNKQLNKAAIDRLAAEFYAGEAFGAKMNLLGATDPHRCEDQEEQAGSSCVDTACKYLGRLGCDDVSEIERVGQACRGNTNGACVDATCAHLGRLGCDDWSEMEQIAQSCRGHHNGKCVDTACKYLGRLGCDDWSEMSRVNQACRGVKGSCVESVCLKLGNLGCDDWSEMQRVTDSCRGN